MEVGDKIKLLRKEKGLSQTLLAKESGVSLPYLNQIEKNKAGSVSDDILNQIAKALSISLSELKDSVKGVKIAFSPSVWSAPILNMLINKSETKARISYTYHSLEKSNIYFNPNDRENSELFDVDGRTLRKLSDDPIDSKVSIQSEKELTSGLVTQELDLIFLPYSYNKEAGLVPIASICSTIKGGIYAVIFSNNPEEKDWVYKESSSLSSRISKVKSDLLKNGLDSLIKNSVFHYQEDSISEFVINEIVADTFAIPSKKRLEIQNGTVSDTISFLESRWEKSSDTRSAVKPDNNGGSYDDQFLRRMLNSPSQYNLIDIENERDDYNIYIGWEPYISRLVDLYQKKYKRCFCVTFDINELFHDTESVFYLDYECFIKSDRLESIKKNEDVRQFFLELDTTIKRLEKLSKSKSISPEIDIIAKILQIDATKLFDLIKQTKFSLKFYPNWSL